MNTKPIPATTIALNRSDRSKIAIPQPAQTAQASHALCNPQQILRDLSQAKSTGHLEVSKGNVLWNLYLQDGQIICASNTTQSLSALDYHFHCLGLKQAASALQDMLPKSQSESTQLSGDWLKDRSMDQLIYFFEAEGYINPLQMVQLLENLTKEAIESFLWLTEVHYHWTVGKTVSLWRPDLETDLDLANLIQHFLNRQQFWQQLNDLIKSPHQRPYLLNQEHLDDLPQTCFLKQISKLFRGLSIRQIALLLNQDELKVAKLLYPHLQKGDVYLRDPKAPLNALPCIPQSPNSKSPVSLETKTYKIACIDDSPLILDEMHKFLAQDEYEITKINDPIKASSLLFRLKPDLILMDITMPEVNGYKLCNLLRSSVALRETPIIMVTGRTGLIDKARAKMNGANDYLVKPFTRGSLLSIVEKYLS